MTEGRTPRTTIEVEGPEVPSTVLLVDDDQAIRDGVGELLRAEGFTVVSATDGRDALQRLRGGLRVDVILLDVLMPVMDGWDFRAAQLADPSVTNVPVVVMTASGFSPQTIGRQLKAHEVFPKPLEIDRFLETLRGLCEPDDSVQRSSTS